VTSTANLKPEPTNRRPRERRFNPLKDKLVQFGALSFGGVAIALEAPDALRVVAAYYLGGLAAWALIKARG
jgi:hypothetical protein